MFLNQTKSLEGLLAGHTPFETRATEPGSDHFVTSKEKPSRCQKIVSSKKDFITCSECKYVAETTSRFEAHFKEPRHVNNYRNLAYKYPKKRQIWLKIWFDKLEAAELINSSYFEVSEEEEEEEDDDDDANDVTCDDDDVIDAVDSYKPKNFSKSFSNTSSWSDASSIGSCG